MMITDSLFHPYDTTIPLYSRNMVYFFDPDGVGDQEGKLVILDVNFLSHPEIQMMELIMMVME